MLTYSQPKTHGSIQLDVSDHDISYDGDAEVEEVYVDETEVESVETTN